MKHLLQTQTRVLLLATSLLFPTAYAQSAPEMGTQDMMVGGRGMHHDNDSGYQAHHKHSWQNSLTSEQSTKIEGLKLEYMKENSPLEAKKKALKTDLILMVIADNPDTKAIDKKIDALTALKNEMMKLKYMHKMSVRKLLTPEQKVQFDISMLKDSQRDRKHGSYH